MYPKGHAINKLFFHQFINEKLVVLTLLFSTDLFTSLFFVNIGIWFAKSTVSKNIFVRNGVMFKISLKSFVLFLALTVGFASIVLAQSPNDVATQTIERLNRTIEQVKDLIEAFKNDRAGQLVMQAEQLRNEALADIQHGELTKARTKVNLAFSLLKRATELALAVPVRRLQSQLEELLQRGDHYVLGSCNKQAERLLQEAKSYRDKALNGASLGNTQGAAEHYRVAVQLVYQAIKIVNKTTDINRDRIQNERLKFENLSERARESVDKCNGDHARRARQVFENAMIFAENFRWRSNRIARSQVPAPRSNACVPE